MFCPLYWPIHSIFLCEPFRSPLLPRCPPLHNEPSQIKQESCFHRLPMKSVSDRYILYAKNSQKQWHHSVCPGFVFLSPFSNQNHLPDSDFLFYPVATFVFLCPLYGHIRIRCFRYITYAVSLKSAAKWHFSFLSLLPPQIPHPDPILPDCSLLYQDVVFCLFSV